MKLFGNKSISLFLYWITGVITILLTLIFLFASTSLLTENSTTNQLNETYINIPFIDSYFTQSPFAPKLIMLAFYILFFMILFLIFKTLKQSKIFSGSVIKNLKWFGLINILIPPLYIIFFILINKEMLLIQMVLPISHIIIGIFNVFIMSLFKKGYYLQQENELTI